MNSITESELLEELRKALGPVESDAFTARELGDALGTGKDTICRKLRPLILAGVVEPTWKRVANTHGIVSTVAAYRIATAPPAT